MLQWKPFVSAQFQSVILARPALLVDQVITMENWYTMLEDLGKK